MRRQQGKMFGDRDNRNNGPIVLLDQVMRDHLNSMILPPIPMGLSRP